MAQTIITLLFFSYLSYNFSNSSPQTSSRPGHSFGHINDQSYREVIPAMRNVIQPAQPITNTPRSGLSWKLGIKVIIWGPKTAHRCEPSHLVSLHSLHEEIWNPKCKEEIPGSLLFLPCVLLQVKELKDV